MGLIVKTLHSAIILKTYSVKNSILYIILFFYSLTAYAQTPTHIDPGHGDDSVKIWSDPLYLWLVIGFIVLLIVSFIFLRRANKNRRK